MSEEELTKLRERMAAIEELIKMQALQLSTLQDQYNVIQDLALKLTHINSELAHMKDSLTSVDRRLEVIEEKPAQHWEQIIQQIITGVMAALLGAALAYFKN